jgi:hypothetical protein
LENLSVYSGEAFIVSERTGKDFPKYGTPGSIMSGSKWWPPQAHVMMLSHFSHNERTTSDSWFCASAMTTTNKNQPVAH